MYSGVNNHNRLRRHNHHHHHHNRLNIDEGVHVDAHRAMSPDYQPASAGSLRRHIAASLIRHHQSAERNKHALQPLSPASYGSSLEIAPYNPAATPESSIELRGKNGESSYSFKTSTELLKVLNRIWSLEEQHASNVSLVKALKHELDLARARIKELLRDQQANRHEIDELMKQISEDNLARQNKEQDRLDSALQSVKKELEDERKLRKRSESLHRKLARELFEVKVALSSSIKELEKERKSNELLEELCGEFAKGIREYAGQVQAVRQKSDMNWTGKPDHDNLVLHLSESWLDEQMQMKYREEAQGKMAHNSSVVDKLSHEIETFLASRQMSRSHEWNKDVLLPRNTKERHSRRRSLESIPEASSAPQNISFEESSLSDPRHIDKTKVDPSSYEESVEMTLNGRRKGQSPPSKPMYNSQNNSQYVDKINDGLSGYEEQEEIALSGRRKSQTPPSVQLSDPRNTPRVIDPAFMNTGERSPAEVSMLKKSDVYDSVQRKKAYNEEAHGSSSQAADKLISELLLSEGGSFPHNYQYKEVSSSNNAVKRNVSPVRQWLTSMKSPDPQLSESSIKVRQTKDGDNTLKSKLQEPKVKGQRSRLKILKDSSQ